MSVYSDLITSEHAGAARFLASVGVSVQPSIDLQAVLAAMPAGFDLDSALGVQLDAVGAWVGIGRTVKTFLSGVYFAWGTSGVGWGEGVWKGPFDPDQGLTTLGDDHYRLLLRATIALNYWDGTMAPAVAAIAPLFPDNDVYIQDNQDMTIWVAVSGPVVDPVSAALLTGGYLALRATTVGIRYFFPSTSDSPVFGWGADSDFIGGWSHGSWGAPAPFSG